MSMRMVYEKAVQDIQTGEKYTLFGFNDFGFPQTTHTVIEKISIEKYAQYDNALFIVHRPKRKRTSYRKVVLPDNTLYIYKGWIDVESEMYGKAEHRENGTIIRTSQFSSFDKGYINKGINSVSNKPIAILDRDYHTTINDSDYIFQVVYSDTVKYYMSVDELTLYHEMTGNNDRKSLRIELQGQPLLKGLMGAMWGGYKEGKAVIRYESKEMYELLSI